MDKTLNKTRGEKGDSTNSDMDDCDLNVTMHEVDEGSPSDGKRTLRSNDNNGKTGRPSTAIKRKKRDVSEGSDSEMEGLEVDGAGALEGFKSLMNAITDRLVSEKRSSIKTLDEVKGNLAKMYKDMVKLVLANAKLAGANEELRKSKAETIAERKTYAKAVAPEVNAKPPVKVSGGKKLNMPKKHITIIKSSIDADCSDDIKAKLLKGINPVVENIHVRAIKRSKAKKLVIETASAQDLEKIMGHEGLRQQGLTALPPSHKLPRIVLFDVPSTWTDKEIKENVMVQNESALNGLTRIEIDAGMKFCFKTGKKGGDTSNIVLEVTPKIRHILMTARRLYLGWCSIKVSDYHGLSRCYKCQGLGHIAKFCKADKQSCGICANEGHGIAECPNKKEKRKCALCKRAGKPFEHAPDYKCPMYKLGLERSAKNTEYG